MNIRRIRPVDNNGNFLTQFYWVESDLSVFLGPFKTQESAIEGAKEWRNSGGILTPEHNEIFLVYSREDPVSKWVWDIVNPRQKLGLLFF